MSELLSKKTGYVGHIGDIEIIRHSNLVPSRLTITLIVLLFYSAALNVVLFIRYQQERSMMIGYRNAWNKLFDGAQRDPDRPWPESRP